MSTTEESVPLPSITERIQVRAREVKTAATRALHAGLRSVGMHDPERGPADYDTFTDERRFYQRLLRERGGTSNNGDSEGNWKTIALYVLGFLQALILAFVGFMYQTLSQTHDDVTTIKCQLNPQCRVVVNK